MDKIMTKTSLFGAALALMAVLYASHPVRAQYMSFFGDSTWKYQYTVISRPPEDYLDYPPETPNALGVYCITKHACFSKDHVFPLDDQYYYVDEFCHDHDGEAHPQVWDGVGSLFEDTVYGRLYNGSFLICDMSLSEGDTFVLEGQCGMWYGPEMVPPGGGPMDTIRFTMIVDSVRYIENRKTIFLSLLDHQDDYFYGTGNHGLLEGYNLSIRFIEGIGPTYGLLNLECYFINLYNVNHDIDPTYFLYFEPHLDLLQCMYKDDSLVYLVHEVLGCDQSCFGFQESCLEYPQSYMNLYPNPATQYVVLDMSTGEELHGQVVITDMLGKQCRQLKAEGSNCRISVADLPAGMYFLTYMNGNKRITRKFLKK